MLEGWAKASIGEIGTVVTGTTPATSSKRFYGGDIPFVAPGDLGNGLWVTTAEKTLTEEGFRAAKRLPKGAVLFTCIGATIGNPRGLRSWWTARAFLMRIDSSISVANRTGRERSPRIFPTFMGECSFCSGLIRWEKGSSPKPCKLKSE